MDYKMNKKQTENFKQIGHVTNEFIGGNYDAYFQQNTSYMMGSAQTRTTFTAPFLYIISTNTLPTTISLLNTILNLCTITIFIIKINL